MPATRLTGRGVWYERQWSLFGILLSGRSYCLGDLEDLRREFGIIRKTLQRDLEIMERIPFFQIYSYNMHGRRYWKTLKRIEKVEFKPVTKVCNHCKRRKSLADNEFYPKRSTYDGWSPQCKECAAQYRILWARRNRKRINERNRLYRARLKREKSIDNDVATE